MLIFLPLFSSGRGSSSDCSPVAHPSAAQDLPLHLPPSEQHSRLFPPPPSDHREDAQQLKEDMTSQHDALYDKLRVSTKS